MLFTYKQYLQLLQSGIQQFSHFPHLVLFFFLCVLYLSFEVESEDGPAPTELSEETSSSLLYMFLDNNAFATCD